MDIAAYQIEVAGGGLCTFLGENELTRILNKDVYEKLNQMVCAHLETGKLEYLLNCDDEKGEWKVLFMEAPMSHLRNKYVFIRVIP